MLEVVLKVLGFVLHMLEVVKCVRRVIWLLVPESFCIAYLDSVFDVLTPIKQSRKPRQYRHHSFVLHPFSRPADLANLEEPHALLVTDA